jgi:hypothetical protein
MIDEQIAAHAVSGLSLLRFFPSDAGAKTFLAAMIQEMCETPEQAIRLVKRTFQLHNEWPGPQELRAVFCSMFKPADGIDIASAIYADGIPAEHPQPQAERLALPPGHIATADPQIEGLIVDLAQRKALPPAEKGPGDDNGRQEGGE